MLSSLASSESARSPSDWKRAESLRASATIWSMSSLFSPSMRGEAVEIVERAVDRFRIDRGDQRLRLVAERRQMLGKGLRVCSRPDRRGP